MVIQDVGWDISTLLTHACHNKTHNGQIMKIWHMFTLIEDMCQENNTRSISNCVEIDQFFEETNDSKDFHRTVPFWWEESVFSS